MSGFRFRTLVCVALGCSLLLSSCSRDPEARKQKYLASGKRYFAQQKYREAAIQFANALQVDSRFADAHYELAQVYMKTSAWGAAYQELQRTIDLQPGNNQARIDLGNLLLAGNMAANAREQAAAVLSKDANNPDAHALMANVDAAAADLDGAVHEINIALGLQPNRAPLYVNLAMFQARQGDFLNAETNIKKAIELEPTAPMVAVLADFYAQQNRPADAEQQYRRAIQLQPKVLDYRARLARFYMAQQRNADAERVLQQAKEDLSDPQVYRVLGEYYLATGAVDKGLSEFNALMSKYPKDMGLKKVYVELLLEKGRTEEAAKRNDEILKANPSDTEGLIFKAVLLMRAQKPADAIQILERVVKSTPENALAHYQLGVAADQMGDTSRAEQEWKQATTLKPDLLQAQKALAQVAASTADYDLLATSADQLVRLQPSAPDGYVLRALAESNHRQFSQVEADLQKAMDVAPSNPLGFVKTAEWRLQQGRAADAEKLVEKALQLDPSNIEGSQALAATLAAEKQPASKIIARLQAQIARAPNAAGLYGVLGQVQARNNDLSGAAASLQKALELNHNDSAAFFLLGQVQTAEGNLDKTIATWQQWVDRNPTDPFATLMLGSVLEQKGNWQQAQQLYQKALQLSPDYPIAANNLAYLLLEHGGNADVALSLAQTARRGMPDSPNSADTLAWAYYKKGLTSMAADLLEYAQKAAPQSATIQMHLGMVYAQENQPAKARQHLQKALQLKPNPQQSAEIDKVLSTLKS